MSGVTTSSLSLARSLRHCINLDDEANDSTCDGKPCISDRAHELRTVTRALAMHHKCHACIMRGISDRAHELMTVRVHLRCDKKSKCVFQILESNSHPSESDGCEWLLKFQACLPSKDHGPRAKPEPLNEAFVSPKNICEHRRWAREGSGQERSVHDDYVDAKSFEHKHMCDICDVLHVLHVRRGNPLDVLHILHC